MSEVREASNVVTSENLAEWTANKLGLADQQPEVVAEAEVSEPIEEKVEEQSEPEVVEQEATPTEEKKQNPKLEKRFSELTKKRAEAEAKAAEAQRKAEELEARLKALESNSQPKVDIVNEKPTPEQFRDAFEYAEALAEWSAEQAVTRARQEEADRKAQEERNKVIQTWQQRLDTVKAEYPDYDEMVASSEVVVPDEVRDAILESEVGPRILYELAQNDELAEKISKSNLRTALRELGKLEARFERESVKDEPKSEPKVVAKPKAPEPIKPLRPTGGALDVGDTNKLTYQQWKELRRAGKIR